jgi:valyl-tRNA synthetase
MVLDENGKKMSKSRGNVVIPDDILDEYSADAIRQGLLQISPGDDIPFAVKDVEHGKRFVRKFWNIGKFAAGTLDDYDPDTKREDVHLDVIDEWILAECDEFLTDLAEDYDNYRLNHALERIYEFVWHTLADDYVEIAKRRLYGDNEDERRAAQYILYTVLDAVTRSMAPLIPFVTEELYHELCDPDEHPSVHGEPWPSVDSPPAADEALETGRSAVEVISYLRRYKSENDLALNAELDSVTIFAPDGFDPTDAVRDAMQVQSLEIEEETPNVTERIVEIDFDYSSIGPKYGDHTKDIERRVAEMDELQLDDGALSLTIDDRRIELQEGDDFEAVRRYTIPGREGDVYQTGMHALLINAQSDES